MAFRIGILGLRLYSLRVQQVQQAGSSILKTNTGKIGCTRYNGYPAPDLIGGFTVAMTKSRNARVFGGR